MTDETVDDVAGFADPNPTDETMLPGESTGVQPAGLLETGAESEQASADASSPPAPASLPVPVPASPPSASTITSPPSQSIGDERPTVPGLQDPEEEEEAHGDLIEITPGVSKGGGTSDLKDAASRVREKKVLPAIEHKEETVQKQWRQLLSGLATTKLVHVRLLKQVSGSYVSAGARYNVDVNEIRQPEQIVPYGTGSSVMPQRWIIKVAPATARPDDDTQYRDFVFERIGPASPPGWSLDSPLSFAETEVAEDDVPTVTQIVEAVLQSKNSGLAGAPPSPQAPPNPYGGYPPYYPPFYPPPPFAMQRSDDGEARRRDDEDRRRREDEDRRRREDEERRRREDTEERRKEREAADAERKRLEERMHADAEAHRIALEQIRQDGERRDREAREKYERLERERADASHRMELQTVNGTVEALRKEIADLKTGGLDRQRSGAESWIALAGTIAPILTNYLAGERESRATERQLRADEAIRDRERAARETDQMMKLVNMFGDSQLNNAKVAGELIQRMQDPGALMGMTKLVTETLGGNVNLIASLARSGLVGGGGEHKLDIGGLVGQLAETAGGIFGNWAAMKERELEAMGRQPLGQPPGYPPPGYPPPGYPPPGYPQPAAASPQPAVATPGAAGPIPGASTPSGPAPEAAPANTQVLKVMVDTWREAVLARHDPAEIAEMISAIVYTGKVYKVERSDQRTGKILELLRNDPSRALQLLFQGIPKDYVDQIVAALRQGHPEAKPSAPTPAPIPAPATPQSAPPSAATSPAPQPSGPRPGSAAARRIQPTVVPAPAPASAPASVPVSASVAETAPAVKPSAVEVSAPVPAPAPAPAPTPVPVAMPGRRKRGRPSKAGETVAAPAAPVPEPVVPPAPPAVPAPLPVSAPASTTAPASAGTTPAP